MTITNYLKAIKWDNKVNYLYFILIFLIIYAKCFFFHRYDLDCGVRDYYDNETAGRINFLIHFMIPSFFIAAFSFIIKNKYYFIPLLAFIDIWIISNSVYFKANGFFIDVEIVGLAGNMAGFWDSVFSFLWKGVAFYPLTTLGFVLAVYLISKLSIKSHGSVKMFLVCIAVDLFIFCPINMNSSVYFLSKVREKYSDDHCAKIADLFIPFHYVKTLRKYGYDDILCYYPLYHNILSQIPCTVYNYYLNCKENKNYKMSQEDLKSDILKYAFRSQNLNQTYHHNKNIIFILVESFDSWTMSDTTEVNIMPNLKRFVNENNVFYCKNVIAQQIHGM